jgi:hypothetical protein
MSAKNKKYELANYISDSGDSIYALHIDQVVGGQVYVSEDKIREVVNEELDRRFGP